MQIRDRIKKLVRVNADELRPNPKNWRTHPTKQQDALKTALADIGIANAVLARECEDGSLMLIDGHLRTETLSGTKIPVLVLDVTELEADKLLATLDPLAGLADQDAEALSSLLKTLVESDDKLHGMVWPDYIIDPLLSADWKPEPIEDLPDRQEKKHTLHFSIELWETIDLGVQRLREINDDKTITHAKALELIVAEWLK